MIAGGARVRSTTHTCLCPPMICVPGENLWRVPGPTQNTLYARYIERHRLSVYLLCPSSVLVVFILYVFTRASVSHAYRYVSKNLDHTYF